MEMEFPPDWESAPGSAYCLLRPTAGPLCPLLRCGPRLFQAHSRPQNVSYFLLRPTAAPLCPLLRWAEAPPGTFTFTNVQHTRVYGTLTFTKCKPTRDTLTSLLCAALAAAASSHA
eukprot:1162116-Pelagomonas_calceolata.AAC.7